VGHAWFDVESKTKTGEVAWGDHKIPSALEITDKEHWVETA